MDDNMKGIQLKGLNKEFKLWSNKSFDFLYAFSIFEFYKISGYFRLLLFAVSVFFFWDPQWFLSSYCLSAILDGFDGYFARKLNQTSSFGAWFDVVIDLICRGGLWCGLYRWGYAVILVEWLTFVSTHNRGATWKIPDNEFPDICRRVMEKGFKTPLGFIAITGVHFLPIWLYMYEMNVSYTVLHIPWMAQHVITLILVLCRLLALRVEIFFIIVHIKELLTQDTKEEKKEKSRTDD